MKNHKGMTMPDANKTPKHNPDDAGKEKKHTATKQDKTAPKKQKS